MTSLAGPRGAKAKSPAGRNDADRRQNWSHSNTFYYEDHGVPHFHGISPNFDFKFAIADCSIISGNGNIRGRDLAVIRAWGQKHRNVLYLNWQRARDGEPLQDIED